MGIAIFPDDPAVQLANGLMALRAARIDPAWEIFHQTGLAQTDPTVAELIDYMVQPPESEHQAIHRMACKIGVNWRRENGWTALAAALAAQGDQEFIFWQRHLEVEWPEVAHVLRQNEQGQLSLNLANRKNVRLAALRGMPLRSLVLNRCGLSDLSELHGLPLYRLEARDNPIRNLEGLADMKLKYLDVAECKRLTDISPLAGMPLRHFVAYQTQISNIDALAGAPLQQVNMSGAPVRDLSPLVGAPLKKLRPIRWESSA